MNNSISLQDNHQANRGLGNPYIPTDKIETPTLDKCTFLHPQWNNIKSIILITKRLTEKVKLH